MRVLIVGAGAIGSMVGGRLALAGHDVTLVGRERLREEVNNHGLTITVAGSPHTVGNVQVVTDVADGMPKSQDVIFLTMKAYDVPQAADGLATVTTSPPPVVTLQNGIGSEEVIEARFGRERVIAGTITTPVEVEGVARVATVDKGGIGLAPLGPDGSFSDALKLSLELAGFTVSIYQSAPAMKWSKLLLNIIGNATSAILGLPPEVIFANPRLYDVELDALTEARQVMAAQQIQTVSLPGYPVPLLMTLLERFPRAVTRPLMRRRVASGRGGKMPSLYLDLEAKRARSEIYVLNGAVVKAGKASGVPTPVNRVLVDVLEGLLSGRLEHTAFRHKPKALLSRIEEAREQS